MTFTGEIAALIEHTFPNNTGKPRDIKIASRLYGWDGNGGCSLQQAGLEYNLTRERVRQISSSVAKNMEPHAKDFLKTVPKLMDYVNKVIPASADRVERELRDQGLGESRIEGVIRSSILFFKTGQYIKVAAEQGSRYITPPDEEGCATRINAKAQKETGHMGVAYAPGLLSLIPAIPKDQAMAFIRDVLESRNDAHWLDEEKNWIWLSTAPKNRLVTCISKILAFYQSTSLDMINKGVSRYFKKGCKDAPDEYSVPSEILKKFIEAWNMATVSPSGIVRKNSNFSFDRETLEYDAAISNIILSKPEKYAREKDLEGDLVPDIDGKTHPKKYTFSMSLNYSPLICRGEKRGEYICTGSV